MRPLHRLVAILACMSFLLTGGLGASARVYICTDADGQVHLETPFDRCCDDARSEDGNPGVDLESGGPAVASVPTSDDCGPCSDQELVLGKDHTASLRCLKAATEHDSHLVLFASVSLSSGEQPVTSAGVGILPPAPPVAAHAPIQTIVLRC